MTLYARIDNGTVVELLDTDRDITQLFAAPLIWLNVSAITNITVGWSYAMVGGIGRFAAPVTPMPTVAAAQAAVFAMLTNQESCGIMFAPASAPHPVLFPTDPSAMLRWNSAYQIALAELWTNGSVGFDATGTPWPLSSAEVQSLAKQAASYVLACSNHAAALLAMVASDPSADITLGWPANH